MQPRPPTAPSGDMKGRPVHEVDMSSCIPVSQSARRVQSARSARPSDSDIKTHPPWRAQHRCSTAPASGREGVLVSEISRFSINEILSRGLIPRLPSTARPYLPVSARSSRLTSCAYNRYETVTGKIQSPKLENTRKRPAWGFIPTPPKGVYRPFDTTSKDSMRQEEALIANNCQSLRTLGDRIVARTVCKLRQKNPNLEEVCDLLSVARKYYVKARAQRGVQHVDQMIRELAVGRPQDEAALISDMHSFMIAGRYEETMRKIDIVREYYRFQPNNETAMRSLEELEQHVQCWKKGQDAVEELESLLGSSPKTTDIVQLYSLLEKAQRHYEEAGVEELLFTLGPLRRRVQDFVDASMRKKPSSPSAVHSHSHSHSHTRTHSTSPRTVSACSSRSRLSSPPPPDPFPASSPSPTCPMKTSGTAAAGAGAGPHGAGPQDACSHPRPQPFQPSPPKQCPGYQSTRGYHNPARLQGAASWTGAAPLSASLKSSLGSFHGRKKHPRDYGPNPMGPAPRFFDENRPHTAREMGSSASLGLGGLGGLASSVDLIGGVDGNGVRENGSHVRSRPGVRKSRKGSQSARRPSPKRRSANSLSPTRHRLLSSDTHIETERHNMNYALPGKPVWL
eukprot:Rmarinus@m.25099